MLQVHIFLLLGHQTTQSVTTIISSLCIPIAINAWIEPKPNESWCEFVSLPLWTVLWDYATGLFGNPCYFHLLSGHSLLRLLFLSSSFNSKWEPFCFVASDFHVRTASWSAPADVQVFWSIHLFRDFLSGKALYSHSYLGGFQSN